MPFLSLSRDRYALILAVFFLPAALRADGFIFKKGGHLIREEAQRAFIEWENDRERLFIATRAEKTSEPTVWMVPVPAAPADVNAEPIPFFRHVTVARPVVETARKRIEEALVLAVSLDTGIFPLCGAVMTLGTSVNATFTTVGASKDVEVHQRIERHGMVVEILTARTTEGLDRYLSSRNLGVGAGDLKGLAPYLGGNYSLICAWNAVAAEPMAARAIRVEFPTPVLFYPLQPSRVYITDVDTAVYIRGWVQPDHELNIPGLRFRYLRGRVADHPLSDAAVWEAFGSLVSNEQIEELTGVELSPTPAGWSEDLHLIQGPPLAIPAAQGIERIGLIGLWLVTMLLGGPLALYLPWVMCSPESRRWSDYAWALGVGLAIGFSIYASVLVMCSWCRYRQLCGHLLFLPMVTTKRALVGACLMILLVPLTISGPEWLIFWFVILVPSGLVLLEFMRTALNEVGQKCLWLVPFVMLHLVLCILGLSALSNWLNRYV